MGVDVFCTVDLELEIRAKCGRVKHYPPLLSFSCHLRCSFSPGFLREDTVPAVRVRDRRRATYQKIVGALSSISNHLSPVFPDDVATGVAGELSTPRRRRADSSRRAPYPCTVASARPRRRRCRQRAFHATDVTAVRRPPSAVRRRQRAVHAADVAAVAIVRLRRAPSPCAVAAGQIVAFSSTPILRARGPIYGSPPAPSHRAPIYGSAPAPSRCSSSTSRRLRRAPSAQAMSGGTSGGSIHDFFPMPESIASLIPPLEGDGEN